MKETSTTQESCQKIKAAYNFHHVRETLSRVLVKELFGVQTSLPCPAHMVCTEKIMKDCSGKKSKSFSSRYPASFISAIMVSFGT